MLSNSVVASQVSRVYSWEVGGLEPAGFAVAVAEDARAVGAGNEISEVVLLARRRKWGVVCILVVLLHPSVVSLRSEGYVVIC